MGFSVDKERRTVGLLVLWWNVLGFEVNRLAGGRLVTRFEAVGERAWV